MFFSETTEWSISYSYGYNISFMENVYLIPNKPSIVSNL